MRVRSLVPLASFAILPNVVSGQTARSDAPPAEETYRARTVVPVVEPSTLGMPILAPRMLAPGADEADGATWRGRVLTALGGAALGVGLGYFASQVIRGDWDEDPSRPMDRGTWMAIGGSLGFTVGFSFPIFGGGEPSRPARIADRGQSIILSDEIAGTGAATAYDAVRLLRPFWLVARGNSVMGREGEDMIVVYLDGSRLGGIEALRQVSARNVGSIEYLDSAAATLRWGAGHLHGAILIVGK